MDFWNVTYYTQYPFTDTIMVMAKNQEEARKKVAEMMNKEPKEISITEKCEV